MIFIKNLFTVFLFLGAIPFGQARDESPFILSLDGTEINFEKYYSDQVTTPFQVLQILYQEGRIPQWHEVMHWQSGRCYGTQLAYDHSSLVVGESIMAPFPLNSAIQTPSTKILGFLKGGADSRRKFDDLTVSLETFAELKDKARQDFLPISFEEKDIVVRRRADLESAWRRSAWKYRVVSGVLLRAYGKEYYRDGQLTDFEPDQYCYYPVKHPPVLADRSSK